MSTLTSPSRLILDRCWRDDKAQNVRRTVAVRVIGAERIIMQRESRAAQEEQRHAHLDCSMAWVVGSFV